MEHYLDNCATTKVLDEIADYVADIYKNNYGNPSSLHKKGIEAEKLIAEASAKVAAVLSVLPEEIYFTSGGTESNNLCILGAAEAKKREGNKIVITAFEHSSVLKTAEHLSKQGFEVVKIMPDKNGIINAQDVIDSVDGKTILVSTMLVNNEIGTVLPVYDMAAGVKQKNPKVLYHCDCVQGFLKLPIKLKNSAIDLVSVSGHKVHAPKGIGAVYVKRGVRLSPILWGGMQQKGVRSGTENVPSIAALGKAAELLSDVKTAFDKTAELNNYLRDKLSSLEGVTINSPSDASPYILNFRVNGIRSEIMLHFLEKYEVYVSSGSACAKGGTSNTLTVMGLSKNEADSAIRVSFSRFSNKEDADALVTGIFDGIKSIRKSR